MEDLVALIREEDDYRIEKSQESDRREKWKELLIEEPFAGGEPDQISCDDSRNQGNAKVLQT